LELLRRNLARDSDKFKRADENMAFAIWILEKEFNVGPIKSDFPLMKIFSLLESEYSERYKRIMKRGDTTSSIGTIG